MNSEGTKKGASTGRTLPHGWRWVRLGDVCVIVSGSTPSTSVPGYWDGDIPWVTPTDLGKLSSPILTATQRSITKAGLANCAARMVSSGTVLMSSRAPIGHLAIAGVPCCTNQGCKNLVPSESVDTWYLFFALKLAVPELKALGSGVTFTEISKASVESFAIPLPPLPEQRRIAAILSEQMAAVEQARSAAEARLEAAKDLPAAYLRAVFSSPEAQQWPKRLFGDIVVNYDSVRVPVKLDERRHRKGAYPYYGASGIIDYVDDYLFDGDYLLIGEDGANLVLRSSPIAFRASGKFWVNNHAHVVRPQQGVLSDYLLGFFVITDLKPYVTGAAQPKLTQEDLNSVPVPLPPIAEQTRIVAILNEQMAAAEQARKALEEELDIINKLPAALLRRAFAGGL